MARDEAAGQEELLYGDEEAEAAYASYEDDAFDEPHGYECCCEDCLQDYPERDALYNDCQFYGVPSDGTVAMLCSYPGCEAIAEIIQEGEPIPAGSIGRKHLFCSKHEKGGGDGQQQQRG